MGPQVEQRVSVGLEEAEEQALQQPEVSVAQRIAVAQRISTLLAALAAALGEEGCTETPLRELEKQIQHLNNVLKVSYDDLVVSLSFFFFLFSTFELTD